MAVNTGSRKMDVIFLITYAVLIVSNVLQERISGVFAYVDEASVVILIVWAAYLLYLGRRNADTYNKRILAILVVFVAIGMLSNFFSGIDQPIKAMAIDLFTCIKFFLMFICVNVITENHSEGIIKLCADFSRLYLLVMLLFLPISYVVDTGMIIGERPGYAFLYGHPSNFAAAVVTCLVMIIADRKKVKEFTAIAALLLIASDRSKAIAFAAVAVFALILMKKGNKIPAGFWIASCIGSVFVAFDQIKLYFLNTETARSVLLSSSFGVANRFFPLGSGFATYGSNITITNYSPLYYDLGFDRVWGLSPMYNDYIADSFWPIVIGQFGYIGLLILTILLINLLLKAANVVKANNAPVWPICLIFIYLIIASTSESAFFASYSPVMAMSMALFMNVEYKSQVQI